MSRTPADYSWEQSFMRERNRLLFKNAFLTELVDLLEARLAECVHLIEAPTRECDQPEIERTVYAARAALERVRQGNG